jgi:hypothetical protein
LPEFSQPPFSRIDPVKKFARTVRAYRELVLNYFRAKKQFPSGIIESLNNKAKVTPRKTYGYRMFRIAELSLCHVPGKLPEPKHAHRFFCRSINPKHHSRINEHQRVRERKHRQFCGLG